jgi:HSP20 family protein
MKLINTTPQTARYASPLAALLDFDREFDRLYPGQPSQSFVPALDVHEDADAVTVNVDLPGVPRENVQVTYHDDILTIAGERAVSEAAKDVVAYRRERAHGRFERSIRLGAQINSDGVRAGYKDGVLTVKLPKAANAKPRQIEVNVS